MSQSRRGIVVDRFVITQALAKTVADRGHLGVCRNRSRWNIAIHFASTLHRVNEHLIAWQSPLDDRLAELSIEETYTESA